jgi:hypothetical protein
MSYSAYQIGPSASYRLRGLWTAWHWLGESAFLLVQAASLMPLRASFGESL